jgi:Cysteine rich repeat
MIRLLLVIPLALIASSALAQQRPGQDACARDVSRFCRSVMNDGDAVVLQCLRQNRHRISKACDKVMTEHGQ